MARKKLKDQKVISKRKREHKEKPAFTVEIKGDINGK